MTGREEGRERGGEVGRQRGGGGEERRGEGEEQRRGGRRGGGEEADSLRVNETPKQQKVERVKTCHVCHTAVETKRPRDKSGTFSKKKANIPDCLVEGYLF